MIKHVCAVLVIGSVGLSSALAQDCSSIANNAERLRCYDKAASGKPSQPKGAPASKATPNQVAFASRLERTLLETGIDAETFIRGETLVLWTWLDRALVYRLIATGKVLDQAKAAGFREFDFWDKGPEGHWNFDLSGASVPRCDRANRLCY